MVYSYQEILKKYNGKRRKLEKAINNREVYKIEKGIYSDYEYANPIVVASKKYPNCVITMDSAFYVYDLTDNIPQKVYIATTRNYNTIKNDKIVQVRTANEILDIGKEVVELEGNLINVYNKERLLIELIRKRKQIPFDFYKELINNYRKISHKLDMYKIEEYISLYKNEKNLLDVLQREVF